MPGTNNTTGDSSQGTSSALSEQTRTATFVPQTEEQIRAVRIGELTPLAGPIQIADYNPEWPRLLSASSSESRSYSATGY